MTQAPERRARITVASRLFRRPPDGRVRDRGATGAGACSAEGGTGTAEESGQEIQAKSVERFKSCYEAASQNREDESFIYGGAVDIRLDSEAR